MTKTDWSQTLTFIGCYNRPYNLFGLKGQDSSQIVRWWVGDMSHKPPEAKDNRLLRIAGVLFIPLLVLGTLRMVVPPTSVVVPLRALYENVGGFALTIYSLMLLVIVVCGTWSAIRARLFPTQADRDFEAEWKHKQQFALQSRTLTVGLWLGKGWRPGRDVPPMTLTRQRNSPPISAGSLPKDRYIYVTLKDLTDEEYAELSKQLIFMDL